MKKRVIFFWLIKTAVFLFLFAFFVNNAFSQYNSKENCRVYLNFPNYSFEISGGFSQLYKISTRYGLFSQECNSFMNYIFMHPGLNEFLFSDEKDECNVFYENFFNRCRCDTTSFLYIYKAPEAYDVSEKKALFDKKIFEATLIDIRDSAQITLARAFPEYIIKVDFSSATRSVNNQEKYFKTGSSKTLFSAHILGAAADFTIYFNGLLIDPTPGATGLFKSAEPYQILGKYILDKGYFWGIPWDPGHMQLKRKFQDILIEYPEFQSDGNLIASYRNIIGNDSIPLKYKKIIEILDDKFVVKDIRNYDMTQPWIDDTLLLPITVDSMFKPSYKY